MNKRIEYLDIAKGFAMICIIFGHLGIVGINSFVFTFHVPIFFLISGYFLDNRLEMKEFMFKKSRQLLIPYMLACSSIILGVTVGDVIRNHTTEHVVENIKIYVIASIYGSGSVEYMEPFYMKQIGALWFLLALFVAICIVKYFMGFQYRGIVIALIAYVGYKTTNVVWLPFSIQAGMTAAIFVYFGVLARKYKVLERKTSPFILSSLAGIWLYCILFCGRMYIVRNYFENGLLDIIGALAGSYLVIVFSHIISRKTKYIARVLKFFGKNSLLLLCCHAFELNVVSWDWIWRFFGEKLAFQYYNIIWIWVFFKVLFCTIGIYLILGLQKIYKKYFPDTRRKLVFLEVVHLDNKNRISYWDMVKGITILLVILGHTECPDYLITIIFSFHMPLFFIANGYFIRDYNIKRTFLRSVKTLLMPYCFTCFISAIIFAFMGKGTASFEELFLIKMKDMVGGMSKISTRFQEFNSVWLVWFVCCLFLARNLYVILMKITEKFADFVHLSIIILLAIAGYLIGVYYAFLPWSLDVALVSLVFLVFGNWMRRTEFLENSYFWILVLPMLVWIYFLRMGIHIELAVRAYPMGIFCIYRSNCGKFGCYCYFKIYESIYYFRSCFVMDREKFYAYLDSSLFGNDVF